MRRNDDPGHRAGEQRERMVREQIAARGVRSHRLLAAMRSVPREHFIAPDAIQLAYQDRALPIGEEQTISQPYMVAVMLEALAVQPTDRALEVGAGSGYAAAVLSRLAAEVFAIERHASLARSAERALRRHGYDNVRVLHADGTLGWPDQAPFDVILVSAGGPEVPPKLLEQLAPGGRLVIPVGEPDLQELELIVREADGLLSRHSLGPVRFVPLIGTVAEAAEPVTSMPSRTSPLRSLVASNESRNRSPKSHGGTMSEHVTIPQLSSATQQVQEWLNDLASRPPFEDPRQAYSLLRAVLHAVRDRLSPEEVAHLGSQLPMIVRGFYFEGWRPALAPNDFTTVAEFHEHVRSSLGGPRPPEQPTGLDMEHAIKTVLEFLADHVDTGELRHVTAQLPEEIARLFPEAVVAE